MSLSQRNTNIAMIKFVAQKLDTLVEQVVFLGGATIGLLLTDPATPDVRETMDVDIIIEVINMADYYSFSSKMRNLGFRESQDVICRWKIGDIIVDCMPTSKDILGFTNNWYKEAIKNADSFKLNDDLTINVISPPYFLATKLEAFKGRGNENWMGSHDLEDIISLLDGRSEIVSEVLNGSSSKLIKYIKSEFTKILRNYDFIESIAGHLGSYPSAMQYQRRDIVLERINLLSNI